MCLMVYLGTSRSLPEIPWDPEDPAFHVTPLETYQEVVKEHLTHPHIYYVGSDTKCGCGFPSDAVEVDAESGSQAGDRPLAALADYLQANARASQEVQLFVTWSGDEGEPPDSSRAVGLRELRRDGFSLVEGELLTITRSP